jgi:hypothetical protein
MMNMAKQQEAAQRQASLAQQTMDYNKTQEARAVETQASSQKEAALTYLKNLTQQFKDRLATISPTDKARYGILRQEIIAAIPPFENELPLPDEWNKDTKFLTISKADDVIKYSKATPVTETIFGPDNKIYVAEKGGLNEGLRPLLNTPAAGAPEEAPRTPTAPIAPAADAGVAMRATGGANTTPQDLIRQGMNPDNIPSGMPTSRPISFNQSDMGGAGAGQMTPEVMSSIVDSAFQTGVMAQVDFDQLLATQPPQNKQALMDSFRRANITLQADAPSLADSAMGQQPPMGANPVQTPQSQFADLRGPVPQSQTAGLRGAPPMEQTLAQTNVLGGQAYGRSASPVSPIPGSAQVPLSRVEAEGRAGRIKPAETAANAQATQNVELKMKPQIAAATKTAERIADLKLTAPKARIATLSLIADIDDRINTIDELLRSPNRHLINGPIEGNLPRLLQTGARADAQAAFDKIKNTATLTSLIDMRKSTETGASPVGANPTDRDARIVEQAASKLIQTGELPKMDAELIAMRQKLYRTRVSAVDGYAAEYGDVIASDPRLRLNAPAIADRYIRTTGSGKKGTSTKVDLNNPLLRKQ